MTNIKKLGDLLPDLSQRKKSTDAPHEIGDCFGLIRDLGVVTGKYNQGYWFSLLKKSGITHHQLKEELIPKMKETETWLKRDKGSTLNRGAWLTNKLSEMVRSRK